MDPRVSTIESDVAAMRANVETIHSNYATNIALIEAESRLRLEIVSSKGDLNLQMRELDQKIDRVAAEQKLEFQKVTSDMRNWLLATVIGMFVGFGGLFLGMARILKP